MGCLLKIIFLPFELIFQLIIEGWFLSMQWIVPERFSGAVTRMILRIIIGIFSVVLMVIFLIGIFGAAFTEATVLDMWKLIFIPIGISLAQIILGAIVRAISRNK